jgi:hypothetical protein
MMSIYLYLFEAIYNFTSILLILLILLAKLPYQWFTTLTITIPPATTIPHHTTTLPSKLAWLHSTFIISLCLLALTIRHTTIIFQLLTFLPYLIYTHLYSFVFHHLYFISLPPISYLIWRFIILLYYYTYHTYYTKWSCSHATLFSTTTTGLYYFIFTYTIILLITTILIFIYTFIYIYLYFCLYFTYILLILIYIYLLFILLYSQPTCHYSAHCIYIYILFIFIYIYIYDDESTNTHYHNTHTTIPLTLLHSIQCHTTATHHTTIPYHFFTYLCTTFTNMLTTITILLHN